MAGQRKLHNFLKSYLEYTDNTESAPIFNKWVGISAIASALQKKTWLQVGRLKVYPNLYIVLVADPGVARKSQAISYATDLIMDVPSIKLSADSGSASGLIDSLSDAIDHETYEGRIIQHASLSIVSREFESFLSSIGRGKMIVTLTDLYDANEKPWKHRTQSNGLVVVPSVYLNILGATTPESLSSSLSPIVFGGGLASRMVFVYSNERAKKVPFPESRGTDLDLLAAELIDDLTSISRLVGPFNYSPEAKEQWTEWYLAYDEASPKRIETRKEFNGWYSRKPMLIQKLSTILSAACSNSMIVEPWDVDEAIRLVEDVERSMGYIINDLDEVREERRLTKLMEQVIKERKSISEKGLLQMIGETLCEEEFDDLMQPLIDAEKVKRTFVSPAGKDEIWYHWKGVEDGSARNLREGKD